jgi:hypothetical protein
MISRRFDEMRSNIVSVHALLLAVLFMLPACKGSSPETQPTSAVVKLSTAGAIPGGRKIGAIDVVLTLAPGVTLKSTTNPPQPDAGVVTASGAATNSLLAANYTAPTGTLPGKVRIVLISAFGFSAGEFAAVNGDIAAGYNPRAADFSVTDFAVTDSETSPSPLTGLTPGLSVDFQ